MVNIISISLPASLAKTMDRMAKECSQTRSEFVRGAIRERILDEQEELARFNHAVKVSKNDKRYSLEEVKKQLGIK
jgi:metal-responsive CopG/Arc/MetJ family transcriptional regulator